MLFFLKVMSTEHSLGRPPIRTPTLAVEVESLHWDVRVAAFGHHGEVVPSKSPYLVCSLTCVEVGMTSLPVATRMDEWTRGLGMKRRVSRMTLSRYVAAAPQSSHTTRQYHLGQGIPDDLGVRWRAVLNGDVDTLTGGKISRLQRVSWYLNWRASTC